MSSPQETGCLLASKAVALGYLAAPLGHLAEASAPRGGATTQPLPRAVSGRAARSTIHKVTDPAKPQTQDSPLLI